MSRLVLGRTFLPIALVTLIVSACAPPSQVTYVTATLVHAIPSSPNYEPASQQPPTSTERPPSVRACVKPSSLYVRSGPGTDNAVVGGTISGDCYDFEAVSQDGAWVRTSGGDWPGGTTGWMAASFLSWVGDPSTLEIEQEAATPLPSGPSPTITRHPTATEMKPSPTITRRPTATTGAITPAPGPGGGNCHPSYPTVCVPPPPPDLDCKDIPYRRFLVRGSDPHRFDGDYDGMGCE